MGLPFSLNTMQ